MASHIFKRDEIAKIVKEILELQPGLIALEGPLGAGKTTLTKEIARQLGIKEEVTSPTFVLHTSYVVNHKSYGALHHIDCWRMEDFSELLNIGLTDIINPKSLVIIEWADKFKSQIQNLLPANATHQALQAGKSQTKIIWVRLDYTDNEAERSLKIF